MDVSYSRRFSEAPVQHRHLHPSQSFLRRFLHPEDPFTRRARHPGIYINPILRLYYFGTRFRRSWASTINNTASISPREIRIWPRNDDPLLFPHDTLGRTPALRIQSGAEGEGLVEGRTYPRFGCIVVTLIAKNVSFVLVVSISMRSTCSVAFWVQESSLKYIVNKQKSLRREVELMGADYDLPEHDKSSYPLAFSEVVVIDAADSGRSLSRPLWWTSFLLYYVHSQPKMT